MLGLRCSSATEIRPLNLGSPLGPAQSSTVVFDPRPMTNLDAIIKNTAMDLPEQVTPNLPKRPGLWRVISLLAVAAALIVSTLSILQSRDASNVAVPERGPLALEDITVTVTDIDVPDGASIAVLGLAKSESRRDFDVAGTEVGLPVGMAALVGLADSNGNLFGLAFAPEGEGRATLQISARSTAQALVLLSPGILRPSLTDSIANTEAIETDPAFDRLVDAIRSNPYLSEDNELVEQAFAEIADRLPSTRPPAEQGCDSVIARDAYPSAGTCVQPEATGLLITNEQDRWALIYSGTEGFPQVCAAISPNNTVGAEVLIPSEQCTGNALMVAPGPIPNQGDDQALVDERVRSAAAVMHLYEYVGPFADLAGANAGSTGESVSHIRRNTAEIVDALSFLLETDEEFAAAMDVTRMSSTALDRHTAAVNAARRIIEAADTTVLIPNRFPGDDGHIDLLDFFVRAGERMLAPRTNWRWEADAAGVVDFGGDDG